MKLKDLQHLDPQTVAGDVIVLTTGNKHLVIGKIIDDAVVLNEDGRAYTNENRPRGARPPRRADEPQEITMSVNEAVVTEDAAG